MTVHDLATALRQRQYALGGMPRSHIDALSDATMIDAYITCACCGKKRVTPRQLRKALFLAHDTDSFFAHCDALGGRHP